MRFLVAPSPFAPAIAALALLGCVGCEGTAPMADDDAGSSGGGGGGGGGLDGGSAGGDAAEVSLPRPSQAVIDRALAAPLSSFHRNASTGDIWCLPCDGAPVVLVAAAFAGDTSVDTRLLEQMRHVLGDGNDPFCTGGYSANDEKNVTAMFAIARLIPRIWEQLTPAEAELVDLLMEAALVADVYATADRTNPSGGGNITFDGAANNREFNPNYREGMIGAVLVGTAYFGGEGPTTNLLAAYDHAAFAAELHDRGLDNASWAFSTYQRNPGSGAPSPAEVEAGIRDYAMHGLTLGQLFEIYLYLADDTFGATVACGLNDGAGILSDGVYAGRIVSGCAALPHLGEVGMEKEFDSWDAEGHRSDAGYVRLGLRANLMNQLVLWVHGGWRDTPEGAAALQNVNVGVTDFFYKATQGYRSYSHGRDMGLFQCEADMDCLLNQALWTEVLAPAHGL